MSKMDRDGYANYIRFETDPDWHSGEIYRTPGCTFAA